MIQIVRNFWRKYWWVTLILCVVPHTVYFFRYAIFSMVHDETAAAIAELSHLKIRQASLTYITPPLKILAPVSGTLGCSFLLMEELWRDCKTVYLGISKKELNILQKNSLIKMLHDVATKPCDAINIADAAALQFKKRLDCGGTQREYILTVAYLSNGQEHVLTTLKGEIK